jgi:hypothetical protein
MWKAVIGISGGHGVERGRESKWWSVIPASIVFALLLAQFLHNPKMLMQRHLATQNFVSPVRKFHREIAQIDRRHNEINFPNTYSIATMLSARP